MPPSLPAFLLLLAMVFTAAAAPSEQPFELKEGDRVVFLGDALIERAGQYGYIERNLTARFPERNVTFRNLGWSGDTPEGQSRVSFDWSKPADDWFRQLRQQLSNAQPTVVFLGYGMANSFDGAAGLRRFREQMNRLIDTLEKINPEMRLVVLGPIRHEALPKPLPAPGPHNDQILLYHNTLKRIALNRKAWFVPLYELLGDGTKSAAARPYTDNGIHLTEYGYRHAAAAIDRGLGWEPLNLDDGPKSGAAEALRQAIIRKNELFFHRWRPQNSTYLFLFRKHEQGQNAREIPMFDPLVEAEEKKIATLRTLKTPPAVETPKPVPARETRPQSTVNFLTDPNIEVTLWAENPMLAKPIQINFDPQGRLWVVSSALYPQIEPGQPADDKVLVLEDADHDGRAEKSSIFAEGLLIPTGVMPGDGGVYVGQSTELLHFKDTNGDGRADQRRVVLSGFGTEDTHHILHTLRWGYDGRLYMNQSIYIHTHAETPHGVVRLNSGGILALRPPTMHLEVFMKGLVNSWGHHYDQFGQSFATDGAGTPEAGLSGISYVVPGAMYHTYAGARRILGSVSPGSYPKFCGLEMVHSQHFPEDWQGNFVTCDFRANRLVRFSVEEQGSAYVTKEMPLLVRSTNVTFRPIDVKVGPDGALYIADWSNPIIQHGEVDFRDPRRDHVHGRIWRVAAKNRAPLQAPNFASASNNELFRQLLSPNTFDQEQARRVLTERGDNIAADLKTWVDEQSSDRARLNGLWMYQAIDRVETNLLQQLLESSDGRVRAAATRVLAGWHARVGKPVDLLAKRIADDHPRVRLEAARTLSRIPSARSAELVLSALDHPVDRHLDYGLWLSINDLAKPWVEAIKSGAWKPAGREKQLEFGLKAIEPTVASGVVSQLVAQVTIPADGTGPWLDLIGTAGSPKELSLIFRQWRKGQFNTAGSAKAVQALSQAAKVRNLRPEGDLTGIKARFTEGDEAQQVGALRLAGDWKLKALTPDLVSIAKSNSPMPVRQAALNSLRQIGGDEVIAPLKTMAEEAVPPAWQQQVVLALAALDAKQAAPLAVQVLGNTTNENEALTLWRGLLGTKGASSHLVATLPKTGLAPVMAKTGLRAAREGGRNEPELILALSRGADLDDTVTALSEAEMKQVATAAARQGDPVRGELVYRRAQLACITCHAIGGAGGKVGPDMTSIGASAPMDYLIESLLYPNRKIKEGYHSIVVTTRDGQELSGILVRETGEQIFIRDALNQEISVPKSNIAQRTPGNSLMPTGLIDYLSSSERLDLFRFLSELGKPGPYDATKGNVARFWRLSPATIDLAQFGDDKVLQSDLKGKGWWPAYGTVDGRLLKEDMETALKAIQWRGPTALYAASQFQLERAGKVRLQFDAPTDAAVWVDGKLLASASAPVELAAGVHTVMVKLPDANKLPEQVRLTTDAGTFLSN